MSICSSMPYTRRGERTTRIFLDVASGTCTTRPGLAACLQTLGPGDTLIVWRLDRLGRSMLHLVTVIAELGQRQVGFRSLGDGALDTTTATGELVFHIFSALAQFERRLIQERTRAGWRQPGLVGKHGGRRPLRADAPQVRMAQTLVDRPTGERARDLPAVYGFHVRRFTAMSP